MPPRKNTSLNPSVVNWVYKKPDSTLLTRSDIQFDFLQVLFKDQSILFTQPNDTSAAKVSFATLYYQTIRDSSKLTGNLKKKLIESEIFRDAFCKLCLLLNVGRINTSLAFYATMKTTLRTYNPIPSLQTEELTRVNFQDAPRLKVILKGAQSWETEVSSSLKQLAEKIRNANLTGPPTSIINLIFLLFFEDAAINTIFFPPGIILKDLFYDSHYTDASRANAFLTLLHHILEIKSFTQFPTTPIVPPLFALEQVPVGAPPGNIDTEEELAYAAEMKEARATRSTSATPMERQSSQPIPAAILVKVEQDQDELLVPSQSRASSAKISPIKRKATEQLVKNNSRFSILDPGWETEDLTRTTPRQSGLLSIWKKVKSVLEGNIDPDYDSDQEYIEGSHDFLLRRLMLNVTEKDS